MNTSECTASAGRKQGQSASKFKVPYGFAPTPHAVRKAWREGKISGEAAMYATELADVQLNQFAERGDAFRDSCVAARSFVATRLTNGEKRLNESKFRRLNKELRAAGLAVHKPVDRDDPDKLAQSVGWRYHLLFIGDPARMAGEDASKAADAADKDPSKMTGGPAEGPVTNDGGGPVTGGG